MRDGFIDCGDGEVEVGGLVGHGWGPEWLVELKWLLQLAIGWHLLSIYSWLSLNPMVCIWFVVTNFPSFIGFDKIRWCEKCLPGTYYTSNFGLD